jgi:hypothetical protein
VVCGRLSVDFRGFTACSGTVFKSGASGIRSSLVLVLWQFVSYRQICSLRQTLIVAGEGVSIGIAEETFAGGSASNELSGRR